MESSPFNTVEEIIDDIRLGKMVVIVDDEDRENEGDLVMAGELVTAEHINFMATQGRGLICTPILKETAERLNLDYMVKDNSSANATPFTVTIDLIPGNTTGISTEDRKNTILAMCDESVPAEAFARPGHIFPLIAKDKGVLERDGHTECAVDYARLAGLKPIGVICEIMNEDGTMARLPDLMRFCRRFELKLGTIKDLIDYIKKEQLHEMGREINCH